MRLINKTQYDTRELRGLACLAYRTLAKLEGKASWWPRLRITVQYGRSMGGCVSGYAYYNGGPVTINLGRAGKLHQSWTTHADGTRTQYAEPAPTRARVLWVMMHELMHSYGYAHKQFNDPVLPETWPNPDGRLTVVPPCAKPAVDNVARRAVRAQSLLDQWLRRQKLAATKVRVYRRKVQYYQHKRAAGKSSVTAPDSSVS